MATAVTRGIRRHEDDRKFEDYESMKKHFSAMYTNGTTEIIFDGFQTMTNTAAALEPSDLTIARIGAEACVFMSTIVDDPTQAAKEVYVTYQSDDGVVHEVTHILPTTENTDTELPLGHEDIFDTCASVAGDVLTMTAMNATLNQYAGWYTIGISGNGDQIGVANLIISNTAHGTTPQITLTDTPDANTATDLIAFQQLPCEDFFRVRRIECEEEVNDDKTLRIGDHDSSNIYGCVSREMFYDSSPNYFSRDAPTARCFLGKIICKASWESTDAKKQGNEIQITLTPKAPSADSGASDVIIDLLYQDELVWEPCIELEPATDVTIKVLALDNTNVDDMYIQVTYLEANLV